MCMYVHGILGNGIYFYFFNKSTEHIGVLIVIYAYEMSDIIDVHYNNVVVLSLSTQTTMYKMAVVIRKIYR